MDPIRYIVATAVSVLLVAMPTAAQGPAIYSATLTVGELHVGDAALTGYALWAEEDGWLFDETLGSLSSDRFHLGGKDHTITTLYEYDGPNGRFLALVVATGHPPAWPAVNVVPPDSLVLRVDGGVFPVAEAIHQDGDFLTWVNPDIDWTEGQDLSVEILVADSVPALPAGWLGLLTVLLIAARVRRSSASSLGEN